MTCARDIVEGSAVSAQPEMGLQDFENLLAMEGISGAPVRDPKGRVIGVASQADVVNALRVQDSQRFRDSRATEFRVAEIMSPGAVFVSPDTPVREIASILISRQIHRILVGSPEKVQGTISVYDLLDQID